MSPRLIALMLCVFGITTGEFVPAGILPDIASDLAVSVADAGLLVTAYAVGMIVGGPVLTALTAGFARKPTMVTLLVVTVAGNLASAAAPSYPVLAVARVVTALVTSTFFANAVVTAASTAPAGRQASTVSTLVFGMNLAMVLGAPAGTLVGTVFGWRATFVAVAAVCALGLAAALLLVPPVPGAASSAVTELSVLRGPAVLLAVTVTAVGNVGVLTVFTYIAPLLTGLAGFAPGAVAGMLLVYGLGATAGNVVGGRLSDRAARSAQLGLLGLLAVALAVMGLLATSAVASAVLVFVVGALAFAVIPGMQARVLTSAARAPTLAIAVNASAYQVAAALAGWLGGAVVDGVGLRAVHAVAAGATVVGLVFAAATWSRDRAPSAGRPPA